MPRNLDTEAAIIVNELDSIAMRIEGLQAHPAYTDALNAVKEAKAAMISGRGEIHQTEMRAKFAKADHVP